MPLSFSRQPRRAPLAAGLTAVLVLLAPARADAQPRPAPAADAPPWLWLRSTTSLQAYAMQSGAATRRDARPILTRLHAYGQAPGAPWQASAAARWAFNPALPDTPADFRLAEQQLELTLEHVWLRWAPRPGLHITGGRQALFSPLGTTSLDGVSFAVPLPRHFFVSGAIGVRPLQERALLNAPDLGQQGDAEFRSAPWRDPLLVDLQGGWRARTGELSVAARIERALDGSTLYAAPLGVQGRLGARDSLHLQAHMHAEPIQAYVTRFGLSGVLPLSVRQRVDAGVRYERPLFALDDLFSIFASNAHAALFASFEQHLPTRGLRLHAGTQLRATAPDEISAPLGQDGDLRGGAELRLTMRPARAPWTASWAWEGDAGPAGWQMRLRQSGTLAPRRGPAWHATLMTVGGHDTRSLRNRDLFGGFLSLAATTSIGRSADFQLQTTGGLDSSQGATFRVMAIADLNLVRRTR